MRKALCNVIANELIELETYSGQFLRSGEIEERARQDWEQVDVPGDSYVTNRSSVRYENITLSEEEVQYVLQSVKEQIG